jgi:O-antigen ligase
MLVLLIPYRRTLLSPRFVVPLLGVAVLLFAIVERRGAFFSKVLETRLQTSGRGTDTHFLVYSFIPDVLAQHPLLGLGYNNFSVYYEFVTGRTNFGPHSFYVAIFVETGIVGALLFATFVVYLFRRTALTRRIGRRLAAAGDAVSARVRPLGWGLTAALVGTLVANAFYLTMSFYYFFVLALLAIAPPAVFARRLAPRA